MFHVITIIFLVLKKQSLSRLDTFKNTVFLYPRTCFCQPPPRRIHSSLTISTASRQLSPCTPCIYMNVHAHNIPIYYSLLKWNGTSELVIRKCKGQAWLCRCRTRSTQIFLHDSAKWLSKFGAKISTHAWDENYVKVGTLNHSSQLILLSRRFNWIDMKCSIIDHCRRFFPHSFILMLFTSRSTGSDSVVQWLRSMVWGRAETQNPASGVTS